MSEWGYVAAAYTVVWGVIAVYALVLARRVSAAERVAKMLRGSLSDDSPEA